MATVDAVLSHARAHSLKQMHIVDAALSMFDVKPAHPEGLARLFLR